MNCPKKFHERNWVSSFKPVILSYSWLIAEIACQNPANETKDFNKTKKKKNSNISHNGSQIWKFNFEILLPHYLFVLLFLISLHCQFHRCMQQLPQLTSWTNKSHYIKRCQCAALLRLILSSLEFVLKKKTTSLHLPVPWPRHVFAIALSRNFVWAELIIVIVFVYCLCFLHRDFLFRYVYAKLWQTCRCRCCCWRDFNEFYILLFPAQIPFCQGGV